MKNDFFEFKPCQSFSLSPVRRSSSNRLSFLSTLPLAKHVKKQNDLSIQPDWNYLQSNLILKNQNQSNCPKSIYLNNPTICQNKFITLVDSTESSETDENSLSEDGDTDSKNQDFEFENQNVTSFQDLILSHAKFFPEWFELSNVSR